MIVMNYASVRADRHINSGLLIVFIPCSCHVYDSRSLSTADTLGLSRDTDGASADAYLDKISSALRKEPEALCINYVSCSDLDLIAVFSPGKFYCLLLPYAVSF